MAGRPAGRPRCLDGMRYRYSQTDPMKGLGGVFGAHPLIALSVLFVLVETKALYPGKHLVATSLPYPHKVNLLADTETTRRSCSSVGIPPLEIAAPVWLARDSEDTLRVKRLPMCSFENDRLCGRAGPRIRRYDEHHDENRPSILASPLLALASKNSWTLLEGSSSSTRCNNLHLKDPGHVRALSWLRWAYYSPPASLRLYCVYTSADIIVCYCPYGWGRLSFNGREIEHAEWLSTTACCQRRGTGKTERSRFQN